MCCRVQSVLISGCVGPATKLMTVIPSVVSCKQRIMDRIQGPPSPDAPESGELEYEKTLTRAEDEQQTLVPFVFDIIFGLTPPVLCRFNAYRT